MVEDRSRVLDNASLKPQKKSQFGVALEPEVIKICLFAVLVGFVGGLVAQRLLELIYFLRTFFSTEDCRSRSSILRTTIWGSG